MYKLRKMLLVCMFFMVVFSCLAVAQMPDSMLSDGCTSDDDCGFGRCNTEDRWCIGQLTDLGDEQVGVLTKRFATQHCSSNEECQGGAGFFVEQHDDPEVGECSEDDDCSDDEFGHWWCISGVCGRYAVYEALGLMCTDGVCSKMRCDDDRDCPDDSVCHTFAIEPDNTQKVCLPLNDADGDGKKKGPLSAYNVYYYEDLESGDYDCNDSTAVCSVSLDDPSCTNSDDDSAGRAGFNDADIQDCWDFCTDADGDGFCSRESVLDYGNFDSLSDTDAYKVRWADFITELDSDDAEDPAMGSYSRMFGIADVAVGDLTPSGFDSFLSEYLFYDCNDENGSINPAVDEGYGSEDTCDFINNDCDYEVDECSYFNYSVDYDCEVVEVYSSAFTRNAGVVLPEGGSDSAGGVPPEAEGPPAGLPEELPDLPGSPPGLAVAALPGEVPITGMPTVELPEGDLAMAASPGGEVKINYPASCVAKRSCVYSTGSASGYRWGCRVLDLDSDGFNNDDFGCPDCTDCNDMNSDVYPGADDYTAGDGDQNCNGIDGEMGNSDDDSLPDSFDECDLEGIGPVDFNGCWYSIDNRNLAGWGRS